MTLPPNTAVLVRHDFTFFMPFYMLVVPTISHLGPWVSASIFGLPRFFGYSAEPSAYAATILPAIYIAWQLKMKKYMYVLIFALLLASSCGAISIFGLTLFVMWLSSRNLTIPLVVSLLVVLFCFAIVFIVYGVYHIANNPVASHRLRTYSEMVNLTLSYFLSGFSWFSGNVNIIPKNAHVLSAYFQVFIKYGFAASVGLSYLSCPSTVQSV